MEERWGQEGRGEGKEVEGDEEDFVEGTEEEENSLSPAVSLDGRYCIRVRTLFV